MNAPIVVGPGVLGLLGVAFIILRLTSVIAWPWIWVLVPFWGPIALSIIFGIVGGIAYAIFNCLSGRK